MQLTAGSNSVRGMWKILRTAGGTARAMLVTAAASTWGVAESTCSTEKGEVVHTATGRRLRYGALVDKAAALPVPASVALKDPKDFRLLGQSVPRLDIPEKVNGSAGYGLDVKRPGLLVARVVRCPVFGGKVASFDADKAKAVAGVRHVVRDQQRRRRRRRQLLGGDQRRPGARRQVERRRAREAEQCRHQQEVRGARGAARESRPQRRRRGGRAEGCVDMQARSNASSRCRSWRTRRWSR